MLAVNNLHVHYGGVHALKGLSFEVPDGAMVALLGANGAGKSTTLRTISGLVRPTEGEILLQGKDVNGMSAAKRVQAGIAMVPEGRKIFTGLTVLENLEMGAYIRTDAEIEEDLGLVYNLFPVLKERRGQRAGTLSGGEQQMLAVGRALMSKPRLLLMDEPSIGLAPNLVDQLFQTIDQIHKEGMTILVVEQNARAALKVSDYGYVIELGKVVLEGSAQELAGNEGVRKAYLGIE
jgi:branched-chain amino acid transport system ATP-binding protein